MGLKPDLLRLFTEVCMSALDFEPPPGTLTARTVQRDGAVTVALTGELDLGTVAIAEEALASTWDPAGRRLVVDLSQLRFMDSTGLRLLVSLHARCRAAARDLAITPGPPAVHRVFEVTKLDSTLPFTDGRPDGPRGATPAGTPA
jgi:anti-anti-sigma factor